MWACISFCVVRKGLRSSHISQRTKERKPTEAPISSNVTGSSITAGEGKVSGKGVFRDWKKSVVLMRTMVGLQGQTETKSLGLDSENMTIPWNTPAKTRATYKSSKPERAAQDLGRHRSGAQAVTLALQPRLRSWQQRMLVLEYKKYQIVKLLKNSNYIKNIQALMTWIKSRFTEYWSHFHPEGILLISNLLSIK